MVSKVFALETPDFTKKLEEELSVTPEALTPRAIFGLNGNVEHALHLHPDKKHIVFPLGNKIGISAIDSNQQTFLTGHSHKVSCLDVSASGHYLASGQGNDMGFRGYVILWDFQKRSEICRYALHKVRVQSLCITAQDKFVVSIGDRDDGTIIVFDIATRTAICRSATSNGIFGNPTTVRALHHKPMLFMCAGDHHLRFWLIDRELKKLHVHDVHVGKHRRFYTSIRFDARDEFAYLGTMSGDIVKIALTSGAKGSDGKVSHSAALQGAYGTHMPRKPYGKDCSRYMNGVRDLILVGDGLLLIGAGDGSVELVEERRDMNDAAFRTYPSPTWPMLRTLKKTKVNGCVTSMVRISALEYYIATARNEIYMVNIKSFSLKLLRTCHQEAVYDIVFPTGMSTIFATAGYESIRIWSVKRLQELLRILVYNFHCAACDFTGDGSSIVSVWSDGVVRSFTPITGRLIYAIPNAHNKGCSAMAVSSNGRVLATGGCEGEVRLWKIEPYRQSLLTVMKEHSGRITTLEFNSKNTEVISASVDGTCIIWDIERMGRKQLFTANTELLSGRFVSNDLHVLTCGSDGSISYWMVYDGTLIRELQGSKKSPVNAVAANKKGDYFASVGKDQLVKLWDYYRGVAVAIGSDHASSILSVRYSPCGKFLVTGASDGTIIIWDVPKEYWNGSPPLPDLDEVTPKSSASKARSVCSTNSVRAKKENIDGLLSSTPKNNMCFAECPTFDLKASPKGSASSITPKKSR